MQSPTFNRRQVLRQLLGVALAAPALPSICEQLAIIPTTRQMVKSTSLPFKYIPNRMIVGDKYLVPLYGLQTPGAAIGHVSRLLHADF